MSQNCAPLKFHWNLTQLPNVAPSSSPEGPGDNRESKSERMKKGDEEEADIRESKGKVDVGREKGRFKKRERGTWRLHNVERQRRS